MNERSMQIKDDIRRISGKILRISKVCYILCIIGAIGSFIGGVTCGTLAFTNFATDFVNDHPELINDVADYKMRDYFRMNEIVGEFDGSINSLLRHAMAECFAAVVVLILVVVMLYFLRKVFQTIAQSETPFTEAILKDLKIMFILVAFICLQNSLLLGIVIGFVMVCLYKIVQYGCMLQQESDETL